MAMAINLVHKYLGKFLEIMNGIPNNTENPDSGTRLVKTFAEYIVDTVGPKSPQQIVDDHDTDKAFDHGKDPSAKSISQDWWESRDPDKPQFLFRSLFTLGPANIMTPTYFKRINQGILCQPHALNNNLRPIEFLTNHVNLIFCRSATTDDPMNAAEVMDGFVEIFTSTEPVGDHEIDDLSFVLVKGRDLKPVLSNRLDLVHALRILFYTDYMIYFANPVAFKFCHPIFLITNVFRAQTNFFPPNKDMDHPLSDEQKSNYLLALGLNVFEAMRKPFDADFFLNSHDLFNSTINPTTMPQPLGIGYVPLPDAGAANPPPGAGAANPPPDAGAANPPPANDIFNPFHFLFSDPVQEGTNENGIRAELFDQEIHINYKAVVQSNEHLAQLYGKDLKKLMIIICPKSSLKLQGAKNYGCKNKEAMVDLIKKHITAFGNRHGAYLQELEAAAVA